MNKFNNGFIIFLIAGLLLLIISVPISNAQVCDANKVGIDFFYSPTCPHCQKEIVFLKTLEKKYPRLEVNYYVVSENRDLFYDMCKKYNSIPAGVPRTFIGNKVFIGFSEEYGNLEWSQGYLAYIGYKNQIENSIRECMNLSDIISESDAIHISHMDFLVKNFTDTCPDSSANVFLLNETYLVAWWTKDRIKSTIQYPNIVVYIDATTGEILRSEIPNSEIEGIEKPKLIDENYIFTLVIALFMIFTIAFMIFGKRLEKRYWITGFTFILFMFISAIAVSIPEGKLVNYAKQFSIPFFTFIIALVDGFNPCAFTVLAFLLSLLTYTKSRRKMAMIGSVFIFTSGFMYFLFIMFLLVARSQLLYGFHDLIRTIVSIIAIMAGIINLKDFFFMKKGISLTMSDEERNRIFRMMGRLINNLKRATTHRDLLPVISGVMILAVMVNVIELGCTFILPMVYIESLLQNYPRPIGLMHTLYTAFYGFVYIIPLFAILGIFLFTFKSERLTERQGRILKLVGGLLMLSLGLILLLKPELLMFRG
ncbi:MAG TPA: hypothetical protein EYP86_02750 [Candidatus Altiarchaeales archaeon]|nr:hypothetical protein [Candidatus Altiarchaeales archaeon]